LEICASQEWNRKEKLRINKVYNDFIMN